MDTKDKIYLSLFFGCLPLFVGFCAIGSEETTYIGIILIIIGIVVNFIIWIYPHLKKSKL